MVTVSERRWYKLRSTMAINDQYFARTRSALRAAALSVLLVGSGAVAGCGTPDATKPDDATIKSEVLANFEANGIQGVTVDVSGGIVTLTGNVYTAADADRAALLAKVDGATKVDNKVQAGSSATGGTPVDPPTVQGNPDADKDAKVAASVKLALTADAALAGSKISTAFAAGAVTLTGTVPTDVAKAEAERVAKTIPGVTSVVNQLQIAAVQVETVPDAAILADVRKLIDQSYPDIFVNSTVEKGVVRIRGAAASNKQILEIADRVSKIKGVRSVDTSLLTVEGTESMNDRIGAPPPKP